MYGTIESTHHKILDKMGIIRGILREIQNIASVYRVEIAKRKGRRYEDIAAGLDNLYIGLTMDNLDVLESNYNLSVISAITEYYINPTMEEKYTKLYYRIITSENFADQISDVIAKCRIIIDAVQRAGSSVANKEILRRQDNIISTLWRDLEYSQNIEINLKLERNNYEVCKCGTRMTIVPEYSELRCDNCGKIKTILGVVFRDDQFYPQEGQKTKHGEYNTGRHYRFWIERIQALENKTFPREDLAKINYVIERDGIDRKTLSIVAVREILKEVKLTRYNDHAALLVVLHGGPAPPRLDFHENRKISNRFHKAMTLYDAVVPDGGNKPYYPYFIYKILEHEFSDKPEKLRLLDYIHLQSRDTVVKNDNTYRRICELAGEGDGLVYTATDPAGRL